MLNLKPYTFKNNRYTNCAKMIMLISMAICIPPQIAQAKSQKNNTVSIGGTPLTLAVPENFCALNPKHPLDKQVLDSVKTMIKGRNELLLHFADCKELDDWHNGKLKYLQNYGSYQSSLRLQKVDLKGKETETLKAVCKVFKKQAKEIFKDVKKEANERASQSFENLKLNEIKPLGVIHEDPQMCAAAVFQKIAVDNDVEEQYSAYSMTFHKGKMLFSYFYAPPAKNSVIKDLTGKLKKLHAKNVKLNQ